VITRDLRDAIARAVAAGGNQPADPGLRPAGGAGRYASSVAFELGKNPREIARHLAARLAREPWIARADVTGPGYLTITVTPETLTAAGDRIAEAGPGCARGDALRGVTLPAPPAADLLAVATWEEARAALAAELTVRLAAAAGATVAVPRYPERTRQPPPAISPCLAGGGATFRSGEERGEAPAAGECPATEAAAAVAVGERRPAEERHGGEVAAAVAFAGLDAVRFSLARAVPGRPVRIDPAKIARHVPDNPAYAVRYAHARAASGVRWAATRGGAEAVPRRPPADPGELALLDALSWLPERVATAARRGRPDEFTRYLEELASVTTATLSSASYPGSARAPGSDKLALARAARAGLAAGLGLLGVSAPDRL
jgi:arginyl-tRNA synthetase